MRELLSASGTQSNNFMHSSISLKMYGYAGQCRYYYVKECAGVCGGVELMRKERVERP